MLFKKLLINETGGPTPPASGNLFTWGTNQSYATAQGTSSGSTQVPTQSGSINTWSQVQGCNFATIALKDDGTLWAVGDNTNGTTGLGSGVSTATSLTQIGSASNWVKVACSNSVVIALNSSGEIYSWGPNWGYGTGQGINTGITYTPTKIGTANNWVNIAASYGQSSPGRGCIFAINSSGELYSCGTNERGWTGQGTSTGFTTSLTKVGSDTDWASVVSGLFFTLAVKTNGEIWGFGYGPYIGKGPTATDYLSPTKIGTDTDWVKLAAIYYGAIALKTNGTIHSFGPNDRGQTGLGSSTGVTDYFTQIGTDTDWADVSSRLTGSPGESVLALKSSGALYGWGYNSLYQLGLNDTTNRTTPTQIGTDTDWIVISGGGTHSLAIKS